MNPILKTGIVIGVLCGIWMFITGFAGWYKDPAMANLFFLVIAIEISGLWWGLRETAREGRTYAMQVVAGTMMAIIAGVIIIVASLLFTMVVFPDALDALRGTQEGVTPMSQALDGFLGTLITGAIASALIAIPVRARAARGPAR